METFEGISGGGYSIQAPKRDLTLTLTLTLTLIGTEFRLQKENAIAREGVLEKRVEEIEAELNPNPNPNPNPNWRRLRLS